MSVPGLRDEGVALDTNPQYTTVGILDLMPAPRKPPRDPSHRCAESWGDASGLNAVFDELIEGNPWQRLTPKGRVVP
jgi:hypothetical protein